MNGKSLVGIICIAIGGLLALKFLHIDLSGIFSFLIPIALIVCGYFGLKSGKKVIGGTFLVIGCVLLLGKLGGLLTLIFAVALIAAGIYFMKNQKRRYY